MIMEKKAMARYQANDHTFAICAYKESPYLEECIKSLLAQKEKSNVIMVTSTPCDYISNMAHKYGVQLYIAMQVLNSPQYSQTCQNYTSFLSLPENLNMHFQAIL